MAQQRHPAIFTSMELSAIRNPTRTAWLSLASVFLLLLQPVLFFRRVLINPRFHIPYDIEGFHLPLISYVAQCVRRGVAPLWDPYQHCGMPIHADLQAQVFYPFTWLAILAGNHTQGVKLFYWVEFLVPLHMVLGGLFTFWLLRRIGLRRPAALLGATVYQLGGFFASQAQHLGAISSAAWLPLMLLAVWELRQRVRLRWIATLALAVSMSILAGFSASTFVMAVTVIFFWCALLLVRQTSWRSVTALAAGFLGGAIIATAELVPLWQLTHLSIASARGVAESLGGGLHWQALVSFVFPNYYHVFDVSNYSLPYNYTYMYVYCGLAAAGLMALAPLVGKSLARVFLLLTLVSAVWMLGEHTPVYRFVFTHLPRLLRGALYAEFALMAFCLFVGMTAAAVLDRLGSRVPQAVLWAVALFTSYDLIHKSSNRPMNAQPGGYQHEDSEYKLADLPGLVDEMQGLVNRTFPQSRFDYTDNRFRQGPSAADMLAIPTPDGDNPFLLERVSRVRRLFTSGPWWERVLPVNRLDSPLLSMLNVAWLGAVTELPKDQVKQAGLETIGVRQGLWIYRNPRALPRFFLVPRIRRSSGEDESIHLLTAPGFDPAHEAIVEGIPHDSDLTGAGQVSLKLYGANRVHLVVNAEGPTYLVSSEPMYPGWQATVNGRPQTLHMTNGAFRGLTLPAGTSDVVMEYHPPYLTVWMLISLISLLGALGVAAFGDRIWRIVPRKALTVTVSGV